MKSAWNKILNVMIVLKHIYKVEFSSPCRGAALSWSAFIVLCHKLEHTK